MKYLCLVLLFLAFSVFAKDITVDVVEAKDGTCVTLDCSIED